MNKNILINNKNVWNETSKNISEVNQIQKKESKNLNNENYNILDNDNLKNNYNSYNDEKNLKENNIINNIDANNKIKKEKETEKSKLNSEIEQLGQEIFNLKSKLIKISKINI